jgi:branched-chain amino acid transport system substrate-binding protein
MVAHAYAEGKRAVALMTLDNAFGERASGALEEELGVAGMALVAVERYAPDIGVLTPEALWVITRQPGAVLVWGLPRDTGVALDALRRRGYEGPIYVRNAVLADPSRAMPAGDLANVRFPVPPILVDDAPEGAADELQAAVALVDYLRGVYGIRDVSAEAARAYDGLDLLRDAAEQAALYGVSPEDVPGYRLALRDAAIALPTWIGAGGTYDLTDQAGTAALPAGLAIVEVRGGRRVAVVP